MVTSSILKINLIYSFSLPFSFFSVEENDNKVFSQKLSIKECKVINGTSQTLYAKLILTQKQIMNTSCNVYLTVDW